MRSGRAASTLFVGLALVLALAGCGRGEEGGGGNGEQGGEIDTSSPSGEISVWAMGTEGENLEVLAEDFMAEFPDATVSVTAVPWDAAHDRIATAIAGNETPDASMIGTTWMGEFAETGALDPTPSNIDPSIFFEGAWDTTVVEDTSYSVPWYVETRVLYYRRDLAEQAGFTEPPASWDDLRAMVEGMVQAGAEYGISLPPGGTGSWQTFMPFAWQAGGGIMNEEQTEFILDSEANLEALEYYKAFFDDGLSTTTVEPGELETGFVEGTIGAFISGPWHVGLLRDQGIDEEVMGLAHLPTEEAGTSFVGGSNLAVFEGSDNRETAWAFIEYLMQPEVQVKWYETVNDLPSVQSAWDDPAIADDPNLSVFGDQLQDAKAPPAIPNWEAIAAEVDRFLEQATIGDMAPDEALTEMQQQAESLGTGLT